MSGNQENHTFALLRGQRHSFMNHLQVISGWLQLNRPDRAQQYLETLASRLATESEAIRRLPPELGQAVIALAMDAETYGVSVDWQVSPGVTSLPAEALEDLMVEARAALKAESLQPDEKRRMVIRFGPGESFSLHSASRGSEG